MAEMSERQIAETIRFWTMWISDFLDEYFENPVIKGYLVVSSIIGTALGPMSPGSAYVLLHHYMGDVDGTFGASGYARGGMGSITKALTQSLLAPGGEVRTSSGVDQILVKGGRTTGVVLANGDGVQGKRVISNMGAKPTFLKHVDAHHLPGDFVRHVGNFKIWGSSGKLNIALDAAPVFPALPKGAPNIKGRLHFTDSIERMERAYDDWTDADRDALGQTFLNQIEAYSPGFKNRVLHAEVRTLRELEAEVGLTEGNIFRGELTFDQQLFNRPLPGYAQYRIPIRDLWMCGSSTHPGCGVMGAPGRNAAAEVLREMKRPSGMSDAYAVL